MEVAVKRKSLSFFPFYPLFPLSWQCSTSHHSTCSTPRSPFSLSWGYTEVWVWIEWLAYCLLAQCLQWGCVVVVWSWFVEETVSYMWARGKGGKGKGSVWVLLYGVGKGGVLLLYAFFSCHLCFATWPMWEAERCYFLNWATLFFCGGSHRNEEMVKLKSVNMYCLKSLDGTLADDDSQRLEWWDLGS